MDRSELFKSLVAEGNGPTAIGRILGISKQRVHQLLVKYGIATPPQHRKGKNRLLLGPKKLWLWRRLKLKGLPESIYYALQDTLPDICPVLGIPINYENKGYTDRNSCPSLDKTIPSLGYTAANTRLISFKANRIKSDATIEEVRKVLAYLETQA